MNRGGWWVLSTLLCSGCLDFDAAQATYCRLNGCGTETAPGVLIAGTPAADSTTHATRADLTFSSVPAGAATQFVCELDDETTFTPCAGLQRSGFGQGQHTLRVRTSGASGPGPVVRWSWTVSPLATSIRDIRTLPVPDGTLVSVSGPTVQLTIFAADRFWMQESTQASSGITVVPLRFDATSTGLVHGLHMSVVGTVARTSGSTQLVSATYVTGEVLDGYDARFGGQDGIPLLSDANEGMWVFDEGTAVSCAAGAFCLYDCDGFVLTCDNGLRNAPILGTPMVFLGVLEGAGDAAYRFRVSEEQTGSMVCPSPI